MNVLTMTRKGNTQLKEPRELKGHQNILILQMMHHHGASTKNGVKVIVLLSSVFVCSHTHTFLARGHKTLFFTFFIQRMRNLLWYVCWSWLCVYVWYGCSCDRSWYMLYLWQLGFLQGQVCGVFLTGSCRQRVGMGVWCPSHASCRSCSASLTSDHALCLSCRQRWGVWCISDQRPCL